MKNPEGLEWLRNTVIPDHEARILELDAQIENLTQKLSQSNARRIQAESELAGLYREAYPEDD